MAVAALLLIVSQAISAQASSSPSETLRDRWTTAKIRARYLFDPTIKAGSIEVGTQNGLVTLMGDVGSDRERLKAVEIARNTKDVKDVIDLIRVGEPTRDAPETTGRTPNPDVQRILTSDPMIRSQIETMFELDEGVKPNAIHVAVNSGNVTLSGAVGPIAHERAVEIARSIRGIKDVRDELITQQ